jgi:hypothetical protein
MRDDAGAGGARARRRELVFLVNGRVNAWRRCLRRRLVIPCECEPAGRQTECTERQPAANNRVRHRNKKKHFSHQSETLSWACTTHRRGVVFKCLELNVQTTKKTDHTTHRHRSSASNLIL